MFRQTYKSPVQKNLSSGGWNGAMLTYQFVSITSLLSFYGSDAMDQKDGQEKGKQRES